MRYRYRHVLIPFALALVAALVLLALAACNTLSPDQQTAIGAVLADMHAQGKLTADQYQALLRALQTGHTDQLVEIATEIGASVVLALFGVRIWRGPITARRGLVPAVVEAIGQPAPAPGSAPGGAV